MQQYPKRKHFGFFTLDRSLQNWSTIDWWLVMIQSLFLWSLISLPVSPHQNSSPMTNATNHLATQYCPLIYTNTDTFLRYKISDRYHRYIDPPHSWHTSGSDSCWGEHQVYDVPLRVHAQVSSHMWQIQQIQTEDFLKLY